MRSGFFRREHLSFEERGLFEGKEWAVISLRSLALLSYWVPFVLVFTSRIDLHLLSFVLVGFFHFMCALDGHETLSLTAKAASFDGHYECFAEDRGRKDRGQASGLILATLSVTAVHTLMKRMMKKRHLMAKASLPALRRARLSVGDLDGIAQSGCWWDLRFAFEIIVLRMKMIPK